MRTHDDRPRIKRDRNEPYETVRLIEWLGFVRDCEDGQYLWWRLDIPEGMPFPEHEFPTGSYSLS